MFRTVRIHLIIPVFFFLAAGGGPLPAQSPATVFSPVAEKTFHQGIEAFKAGHYETARSHLEKVVELAPNQRSSAAQLVLSKALFQLQKYEPALDAAKQLQKRFGASRYLADANLVAGDSHYALRRYSEAAVQYGRVLSMPSSLALQASAAERLAGMVKNGSIGEEALGRVRRKVGAERLQDVLFFGEAYWYRRLGWEAQSREAMQTYLDKFPWGLFRSLAAGDAEPAAAAQADPGAPGADSQSAAKGAEDGPVPRLGLLLPLSGPQHQIGEDLYAGIQLANEELDDPFELIVADTGFEYGDLLIEESEGNKLLRIVLATRTLIEEEDVVAIIGPVFSSSSVAAAAVAASAGVPMVVPLADQSGLDSLGSYVFQLKVIPEVQGRALAEYATLVLGLEKLVAIVPLSDYGWNFSQEFAAVAYANGGEVVHLDWYYPGQTRDFKYFFEEVRRVGFALEPAAVPDSVDWTAPDSSGRAGDAELVTDPLEEEEAEVDSAELFISTIDGIAMVVEDFEDARTIVPQLYFHRLETQILGNDVWNSPEAIRQMRRVDRAYLKGAVFVTQRQDSAPTARSFMDSFRRRFARDPDLAAYGYDAARLLISGWRQGRQSRRALGDWLAGVQGYEGASGSISFAAGRRANAELVLQKIDRRGRVVSLGPEDLPDLSPAGDDLPRAEVRDTGE